MNSADLRDRITELLTPVLAADALELEDVELTPAGRRRMLRLIVDADNGVSLDQLAETSQVVANTLDASELMGSISYTLEVTSRGVDRPLTAARHWQRNAGRLVKVHDTEGRQFTGRVIEADADGADLDLEVEGTRRRVPYGDVQAARVEVEFRTLADDAESRAANGSTSTQAEEG